MAQLKSNKYLTGGQVGPPFANSVGEDAEGCDVAAASMGTTDNQPNIPDAPTENDGTGKRYPPGAHNASGKAPKISI